MIEVTLDRPWLTARLRARMRCLSWAPVRSGFVTTDTVLWREVRNADLTEAFDAIAWLDAEVTAKGARDAVAMLTSRDIGSFRLEHAGSGLSMASCCATVGLSNAERIGTRRPQTAAAFGTINLLAATATPLTEAALIEAISIATQARTAAVMDHGPDLETGQPTGTGTDCIVVAAPAGAGVYAGLHTDVGEAIGRAVYRAVAGGTRAWMETEGRS